MSKEFQDQLVAILPRLRRFAMGLTKNLDAADDLVQQACEKALIKQASWEPGSRLDSWVYRIIQNQHIDNVRKESAIKTSSDDEDTLQIEDQGSAQSYENQDMVEKVSGIVEHLPAEQKTVMLLVAVEGHSYADVAALLNVPTGTVMSRLHRARSRIQALLAQRQQQPANGV